MFRRLRSLAAIATVALLVRIAFAWMYIHSHPARALGTIPFLFEPGNIAFSLVNGNGFSSPFRIDTGPTAWMTPVYPLILAGIFRIFGVYTFHAYLAAAGLNILFSVLTCVPIYYAGRRVGGERVAIVAASLWAVFPTAILLPYESLWDASLAALLAATIVWATLRETAWWLYGLIWGFALMVNAALVSVLPFLFVWNGRRAGAKPLGTALVILACCVPWTVRNYRVFHTFVPLRSVGGLALWLGNTPEHKHPISDQVERDKYVAEGEIAYMAEKQSEAIAFMREHPAVEARGSLERFIGIWTGAMSFAQPKSPRFYWVTISNLLAAAGALAGGVLLWRRRNRYAFPLTVFPVIFPAIYYLALAPPRYRHPIDPVLLLLTAIALTRLEQPSVKL